MQTGHVGIGDIVLRAKAEPDTSKMNGQQKAAQTKAEAAARAVTFWETMPEFRITMGVPACNLWALRKRLDGLVVSVPTARLSKQG